jgi:hypothetical protein
MVSKYKTSFSISEKESPSPDLENKSETMLVFASLFAFVCLVVFFFAVIFQLLYISKEAKIAMFYNLATICC